MTDDDEDLLSAVTERALARAVLGSAGTGLLLGVLAAAFLVLSSSRVDATTVPVVVLLLAGQAGALAGAAAAAVGLRRVRAGHEPRRAAGVAQRTLRQLAVAVVAVGAVIAVAMPLLLQPRGTAALMSAVGLGVLAQVAVVLTVLRRPLQRVARAPGPPARR